MKNGYKIFWTPNALNELAQTFQYLEKNFGEREIKKLAQKVETTTELISKNPNIFPKSSDNNIYKAVILKYKIMYYRIINNKIEILSFFSNRKNPENLKL